MRAAALAVALTLIGTGCDGGGSAGGAAGAARQPEAPADTPLVAIETSSGRIVVELYPWLAEASVENFLAYLDEGYYDGLIFHRVKPEFVIQAGGYDVEMNERPGRAPIPNESNNGLSNTRGTIAMARFSDPHSASSQFYINVFDNRQLDYGRRPGGWGYAVFGTVRSGIDVVDSISMVRTGNAAGMSDVPLDAVLIDSVRVLEE